MKRIFSMFIFCLIIFSCESKQEEQGYWTIHYDEVKDSSIYPEELYFKQDTLLIQSSHYFKQVAIYKKKNDTIYLTFKNGIERKYPFSILSDSIIEFAKMKFIRTNGDNLSKAEPYELIGYQSKSRFIPHSNSTIIHLIKYNSEAKVILNDVITNLSSIPEFLNYGQNDKPKLYLYLGKGIEINDLIKTYCWILVCEIYKVELITHYDSFEEFHTVKDYLCIEDSLYMNFIKENKIPQSGLLYNSNTESEYAREKIKFFQNELNHSSIIEYLRFTEQLNFRMKVN